MNKYLFLLLIILMPAISWAEGHKRNEKEYYIVTDILDNVFTIKGADFYFGTNRDAFPIQVGDELVVLCEERIPLADGSYSILIELQTMEGSFKEHFISTIMNDDEIAHVKERIMHTSEICTYTKNHFGGESIRYEARATFTLVLEDDSSYYVWDGLIHDSSQRKEAEAALEKFYKEKPTAVRITNNGFADIDEHGNRYYTTKIAEINDTLQTRYEFNGKGARRKRGSLEDLDKFQIKFCHLKPCPLCGEKAWQFQFETLSSNCYFSLMDHERAHCWWENPTFYSNGTRQTQVCSCMQLLRIEEDPACGRIFIFKMLPHGQLIFLYLP